MSFFTNCFPCGNDDSAITDTTAPPSFISEKPSPTAMTPYRDDPAQAFLDILRTAEIDDSDLQIRLKSIITVESWTEALAESILHGIVQMICDAEKVASAMEDAIIKATNQAKVFAKEHPYYTALIAAGIVIAIGVLVIVAPWVLEAIGFAARGPRAGK